MAPPPRPVLLAALLGFCLWPRSWCYLPAAQPPRPALPSSLRRARPARAAHVRRVAPITSSERERLRLEGQIKQLQDQKAALEEEERQRMVAENERLRTELEAAKGEREQERQLRAENAGLRAQLQSLAAEGAGLRAEVASAVRRQEALELQEERRELAQRQQEQRLVTEERRIAQAKKSLEAESYALEASKKAKEQLFELQGAREDVLQHAEATLPPGLIGRAAMFSFRGHRAEGLSEAEWPGFVRETFGEFGQEAVESLLHGVGESGLVWDAADALWRGSYLEYRLREAEGGGRSVVYCVVRMWRDLREEVAPHAREDLGDWFRLSVEQCLEGQELELS